MPDKGKVERPFRYVREDFFLARSFRSLDDLNAQFRQWLDQVANRRLHATTRRIVVEHFAEERPALRPLPAGPYEAVLGLERRITREGTRGVAAGMASRPSARVIRSNVSGLVAMARRSIRRAPALSPSARPTQRCRSPSRRVRRAPAAATSGSRSAKVCRVQVGSRQRNRRAWRRSVTGRPCHGRSARRRW